VENGFSNQELERKPRSAPDGIMAAGILDGLSSNLP
jgi:hypothetical protein